MELITHTYYENRLVKKMSQKLSKKNVKILNLESRKHKKEKFMANFALLNLEHKLLLTFFHHMCITYHST